MLRPDWRERPVWRVPLRPAPQLPAPVTGRVWRGRPRWAACISVGTDLVSRRVQRLRKVQPGIDYEQDPWREIPWCDLPPLSMGTEERLVQLRKDMEEAYGEEHIEPWHVRRKEIEEVFRPNRCANTYGELDHNGFARLLQEASLQPHHRFCDVGSGLGKLVLCAAVVTCAECYGVEISPHRHQCALEGFQRLKASGAISAEEASRVHLLGGNCAAEDGVPQDLLRASHLILTMRRSTQAVNRLYKALHASGPLLSGEDRILWSVTHHLKMREGMTFQRRLLIEGFELPQSLGPDNRICQGKVTQEMVLHEYRLAF
ncbi:unnamed protein product [Durusdinium trenchii]|uniref:Histone-lysine N-methyltransferase, H3 lysine-79 specific n=1 Tax=Durusdinium trenchii TaxID=1381693 RepID=A0ABP0KTB2_9DINO